MGDLDRDQLISFRQCLWWAIALVLVCALPGALMALGVDFGTRIPVPQGSGVSLTTDSAFQSLRGSFTHTILEWTACCAALGVCCLAFVRYRLTRDPSMPIIGVALVCAGAMDAFHTLAADRLIASVADNRDLIPFTWAICRLFNALIILAGVGLYMRFGRNSDNSKQRAFLIPATCIGFVAVAYAVISYCAGSETLPNTMFHEALFKRPYDLAALIPFLFCGLFLFPPYVRGSRSVFSIFLYLSLIPQVATQLYMAFGSSALFDPAFNVAHALKPLAYLVPITGLLLDHTWTAERVTELAKTLERSKSRSEAIMKTAAEGIIAIDARGIIDSCNGMVEKMFGYESGQLIGENVSKLMPAPESNKHDGYLRDYLTTGKSKIIGRSREVMAFRKDGTSFPIRLSVSAVSLKGEAPFFTGLLHDLSEEHELQAQLTQSQKLESIGQLAAGIAHEINTPTQYATDNVRFLGDASSDLMELVSGIFDLMGESESESLSSAEMVRRLKLKMDAADLDFLLDEIPQAIDQSLEGLGSVARIVRAMKEFSHPGREDKTEVNLNHIIQNTVTVARNEWKYVAELKLDLESTLPPVPCIQGQFNQVILNMIVNAAHAIAESMGDANPTRGHIVIKTSDEGECAQITIDDDGMGMTEEVRARAFDPFFTTKAVGKGTGQGLAIARSVIVDKHQGTIEVQSKRGQGTRFTIRLPLLDASQEAPSLEQHELAGEG